MANLQILNFYGWWQFVTCLFAFVGLMSIWYHLGRKKGDIGQVWLALSILCWSFSGLIEIYYAKHSLDMISKIHLNGWRSILSLLNSLLILFALPWFRYPPKWLDATIKSKYWYLLVGLPFIFCLLPTISKMITGHEARFIIELDVYYAVMTLVILSTVLWESFTKRGLQLLAYLSLIFIVFTLIAQVYKFTENQETLILFSAIFKSSLIMIFFALALSWVKDLSETLSVKSESISIELFKHQKNRSKTDYFLRLKGLDNHNEHKILLSATNFNLLQKFAFAKQKSIDSGWLQIKPKAETRTKIEYDIKDHNEIKRLISAILDGAFGRQLWSKERHEIPFKEAFFEFSKEESRKIRLKIASENIIIV